MGNDDTRDIAIRIVDKMVNDGLIIDCTDTENEIEFAIQDIIHEELNKVLKIKED